MSRNNLINMAWMQALWFTSVLASSAESPWPAPAVLIAFVIWQIRPAVRVYGDFRLIPAAVLLSLILDGAWVRLGWLEYASTWPFAGQAPLWILCLWAGLALTLNHSLAWLQSRLRLAGLLGAVCAPASYAAAERLGGLRFTVGYEIWITGLGLSWALAIPLLLWLARSMQSKAGLWEANHV